MAVTTTSAAMDSSTLRGPPTDASGIWRDTLGNLVRQRNAVVGGVVFAFFIVSPSSPM